MPSRRKAGSDVFDSLGSRVFVDVNIAGTGVGTCGERGGAKHGGLAVVGTCNIGGGKDGGAGAIMGDALGGVGVSPPLSSRRFSGLPDSGINAESSGA